MTTHSDRLRTGKQKINNRHDGKNIQILNFNKKIFIKTNLWRTILFFLVATVLWSCSRDVKTPDVVHFVFTSDMKSLIHDNMKKLFFLKEIFKSIRSLCFVSGLLLFMDVYGQTDTISFLHITDTHLIFHLDLYHQGTVLRRNHFGKGITPFVNFLQTVPAATDSKMVVITGDVTDFYESDRHNGDMFALQIQQFARIPEVSQIPVFCTLGNHDVASYGWKNENWYSTQSNAGKARAEWIRNVPCFADGTWYSHIYKIGQTGYRFIFLDNAYTVPEREKMPYICYEQLHWLKDQLEQSPDEVKIVCMHIPFSKELISDPNRNNLYALLAQHQGVKLVLAGHRHENVINSFDGTGFIQVETAAFGYGVANWRLIKLTADKIIVSSAGTKQKELIIPIR